MELPGVVTLARWPVSSLIRVDLEGEGGREGGRDRQTDRQTERQTERERQRQTDGQTETELELELDLHLENCILQGLQFRFSQTSV